MIYQQPRRSPEAENGSHQWSETDDPMLAEIENESEGLFQAEAGLPGAKKKVGVVAETGRQEPVTEVERKNPSAVKERLERTIAPEMPAGLTEADIEKETADALALIEEFVLRGEAGTDILKVETPNPLSRGERFLVKKEDMGQVARILTEKGKYNCQTVHDSLLHCSNGRINLVFEAGVEKK